MKSKIIIISHTQNYICILGFFLYQGQVIKSALDNLNLWKDSCNGVGLGRIACQGSDSQVWKGIDDSMEDLASDVARCAGAGIAN